MARVSDVLEKNTHPVDSVAPGKLKVGSNSRPLFAAVYNLRSKPT
jgi:hypothetical protein